MRLIVFLLSFIAMTSLYSMEVKNVIKFEPSQNIKQGDLVNITMQLWPVENYNVEEFNKLKNQVVLSHFYVVNLEAKRSENNYDVVLLNFSTIAESPAERGKNLDFQFGEYVTTLSLPFEVKPMESFDGSFVILNQAVDFAGKNLLSVVVWATVLLAMILIFIKFRKKIMNYFNKNVSDQKKKSHFQTLFHSAKERHHYEEIYKNKDQWLVYFPEKNNALLNFYKIMEEHQYKRQLSKEDLFEIKEAFDKIRGGIK